MSQSHQHPQALIALEFSTTGAAWQALNHLTLKDEALAVVECTTLPSGHTLLLISGEQKNLQQAWDDVLKNSATSFQTLHSAILDPYQDETRLALHSLAKSELSDGDALLIFESSSPVHVLALSNELNSLLKIKILDLRIGRASGGRALVYFAGAADTLARAERFLNGHEHWIAHSHLPAIHHVHGHVTLISKPSRELHNFF